MKNCILLTLLFIPISAHTLVSNFPHQNREISPCPTETDCNNFELDNLSNEENEFCTFLNDLNEQEVRKEIEEDQLGKIGLFATRIGVFFLVKYLWLQEKVTSWQEQFHALIYKQKKHEQENKRQT